MIQLGVHGVAFGVSADIVGRVSFVAVPANERPQTVRVITTDAAATEDLSGYAAVVASEESLPAQRVPWIGRCRVDHLCDRDIVLINPRGYVRTVIRHGSRSNSLFATDRCNSFCLMCSQPPREVDDSGKAGELIRIVRLMDPATAELGITGGEPTLLGDGLLQVIAECKTRLPRTSIHILSNGRQLPLAYSQGVAAIGHPDLMFGVPLYSDIDSLHDHVVQARGAFDETVTGLLNLGRCGVPVELRVVVHQLTAKRLVPLSEFIYRNFTFAAHVAFMGLEVIGFAKANLGSLALEPEEYSEQLSEAVAYLAAAGMNVSVYNHQLCRVPRELWPFCRQAISDWKNDYAPECLQCDVRTDCGGFFTWNLQGAGASQVRPIRLAANG